MSVPPIPQFLAHLPTKSGLVVPYISMELDGQVYLGQTRGIRIAECLIADLCQVCGRGIENRPYLFLVTQRQIDGGFSPEPPLHPVCAAYSIKACPMVGGRMATYARHSPDLAGRPCDEPGCTCPGVVINHPGPAGEPAEPWFRAWYPTYDVGVRDARAPLAVGNITGAVLRHPIKIRPLTAKETGRA